MKKFIILFPFLLGMIHSSTSAQSVYPGQHEGKFSIGISVPCRAQSFDLRDVRLLKGRVHDNLKRDSIWMSQIQVSRLLHSFRNNAGVFAGLEGGYESVRKFGGWESLDCDLRGHTTGHLLSAYGLMYAATGDDIFKLKGDSIVSALKEVQDVLGGGYLSAFPEEFVNRNLKGKSVWAPWYTLHKLFSGLIDQYLYADNELALDIVRRMGDWAYNKLNGQPEETRRLMLRNEFGGINESFYNLYAITGDERYLMLARFFYHNDVIDPLANGNVNFGTKHTNTLIPKVIGEIRNYELTGDSKSNAISHLFWREVTGKHTYVTGSCSQKEHFFDPDKMSKFINGYTGETCCSYNMLKLSRHLFCLDAAPEIADYYERVIFNHILGQQDTQTGMVCYFLPLLSGAYKVYSTPERSFWCCVGSGFESHAKYGESIYYHGEDDLYVNLFIPSRVAWKEKGIVMTQATSFPESDRISLTFDEAKDCEIGLKLRYPFWSGKPEVRVNGKSIPVKDIPSSYITIRRKWNKGDNVEVKYPMSLRVETTPDNPQRGALLYGPVVLAGDMGNEGFDSFSNPELRNDYYTYDYKVPSGLDDSLLVSKDNPSSHLKKEEGKLVFTSSDGKILRPLYDLHHTRYVVYWNLK